MNKLLEDLKWRGLIYNSTDLNSLSDRLDDGPIQLYCGFDPTADSLHLGSLQVIMLMHRFMQSGNYAIALMGGGTGLIGDPSGKKEERSLKTEEEIEPLILGMQTQLKKLLHYFHLRELAFIDNIDWLRDMTALELLRDYGKHFNINAMLKRDSVATRMDSEGISFTEFSYMILQAVDFLTLNNDLTCELQIGGSDQWGNMSAGLSLIRSINNSEVHALTCPLILNSNGTKFGKSESGTIWLNPQKTTPMEMYQYLVNVSDEQAKILLRQLTLFSKDDIKEIETNAVDLSKREIQKIVAFEIVEFVHGKEIAINTRDSSEALFSNIELAEPSIFMDGNVERFWDDIFVESGLVSSKTEARKTAIAGGLTIWGKKILDAHVKVQLIDVMQNGQVLLGLGKKHRILIGIK